MAKNIDAGAEIVFSSASDLAHAQRVSRLARIGQLKKIRAGIYTSNLDSPIEAVVSRNWRMIAEYLFPGAVVGYRSGMCGGPEDGKVFLVSGERAKRISLPGLEFVVVPGSKAVAEGVAADVAYGGIFVASEPRRLLENLSSSKGTNERTIGRVAVESELERILALRGEQRLNVLRDAAKNIAPQLGLEREFGVMNQIVSALLKTHDAKILQSKSALARAAGAPYDPERLQRFDALFQALHATIFEHFADAAPNGYAMENFAFFEAYFSNFIEGTEFTLEEAESIVFQGKNIENRSEDSHDIRGTFQAIVSPAWRKSIPVSASEFLQWVKSVNALVLQARPEKCPGVWKTQANQAGSSLFVQPELVPGTLREGYERINTLIDPVARALMAMFVVAEVHPFSDGNGRTARIAMNACLSQAGLSRIIIPTVYREDYLLPLKALTHQNDPIPYIRAMVRAHAWSASIKWEGQRDEVRTALISCNAFEEDLRNFRLVFPENQ